MSGFRVPAHALLRNRNFFRNFSEIEKKLTCIPQTLLAPLEIKYYK